MLKKPLPPYAKETAMGDRLVEIKAKYEDHNTDLDFAMNEIML